MALTQITAQVISANAISPASIADDAIQTRHIASGAIIGDHLSVDLTTTGAFANSTNLVQSNVVATQSNVNIVNSNVTSILANLDLSASTTNTKFNTTSSNVGAVLANLDSFASTTNTKFTNITTGVTPFSSAVTMQSDLTVQGNFTVTGTYANVLVQDAVVNDRVIYLANNFSGSPTLDTGLLLNRGTSGNVFIGYDEDIDYFVAAVTQSPKNNTTIALQDTVNFRSNLIRAESGAVGTPTYSRYGDENTGIWFPSADSLAISTGGVLRMNVASIGEAYFSDDVSIQGNANAGINLFSANAVISTTIWSDGVELRSNDWATLLAAYSNDYSTLLAARSNDWSTYLYANSNDAVTYTKLNANINVVQDNVAATLLSAYSNDWSTLLTTRSNDWSTLLSSYSNDWSTLLTARSNDWSTLQSSYANDAATYTKLDANINVVQNNIAIKLSTTGGTMSGTLNMGSNYIINLLDPANAQDAATRAYVLSVAGTVTKTLAYTTSTSSGTSNVVLLNNTPISAEYITVWLNGVAQEQGTTKDWVFNSGNSSIQYTVNPLPSGLTTLVQSWEAT